MAPALVGAALLAALPPPAAVLAVDAMDGEPDGDAYAGGVDVGAWPDGADSLPAIERLKIDLHPGGELDLSVTPDIAPAGFGAWEADDLRPDPSAAPEPGDLVPLETPDWLRLSGTLEPSGLGLAFGAAGLTAPDWHGLSGVWRLGLDARLAAAVPFEAPLPGALSAEYDLALPLAGCYGPLSVETELLDAAWRSGEGLDLAWPPDTVRLRYGFPDPLAYLGVGDSLMLAAEAERVLGAEPRPLAMRGRLAWEPGGDEEAGGWSVRPRLELDLGAGADAATGGDADLGLDARLEVGRDLLPGRRLRLAFEFRGENLLDALRDDDCPGDRFAAVRLSF